MWDDHVALNRISRLILVATALFALWVAGRALLDRAFPFREVAIQATTTQEGPGHLHGSTHAGAQALIPQMAGGFFSMNLATTRTAFQGLPWVRNVDVRRQWPGRLVIHIEEHRPAAAWNDRATLNTHGEVFSMEPSSIGLPHLPRIYAPDGMEKMVARRFGEFAQTVTPLQLRVEQIVVTARQSWRVRLSSRSPARARDEAATMGVSAETLPEPETKLSSSKTVGMTVELGRERIEERLMRFARAYPQAVAATGPLSRVDMRYPNGFAAQVGAPVSAPTAPNNKASKA